jgi:membrane associated rhomboid family serine protease
MDMEHGSSRAIGFVRPGPAVTSVMVALGAIWLMFALAVNWGDASEDLFYLFCGNTERILHGEVWRLFTAPLMHQASGTLGHIFFAILGLLFLAPALEQKWGSARMLRFLVLSAVIAYGLQMLFEVLIPRGIGQRLFPSQYWYGAFPVLEAVAIAWALSFRGQTVNLFFVIPVTSRGLVMFVIAMSALRVVANSVGPEGFISPFGGMLAGWLLGGSTPSPLRRAYLRLRLAQLDREAARGSRAKAQRVKDGPLRVIEGGRGKSPSRDDDGAGGGGRMLH